MITADFCAYKLSGRPFARGLAELIATGNDGNVIDETGYCRIDRGTIPPAEPRSYAEMFDDLNDLQLQAAIRWGVADLDDTDNIEQCDELMELHSTRLLYVEEMTYSKPYLVPAAVLLTQYIGERFAEVYANNPLDGHKYRPIITSAFRTDENVRNLRRVNGNATEMSCHCFGTTIDITYKRFMRDDGLEVEDERLKAMLAQTLYELRYEGLCYVRYEVRQPCFHITVRDVEYRGQQSSRLEHHDIDANIQQPLPAAPDTVWFNTPRRKYAKPMKEGKVGQYISF